MGKAIMSIVTVIVTTVICFAVALNTVRPATEAELEEFRAEVNERFNDVEGDLDTVKRKLSVISVDLDSLKSGQIKIFNGQQKIYTEVKKASSKDQSSFWDRLFN